MLGGHGDFTKILCISKMGHQAQMEIQMYFQNVATSSGPGMRSAGAATLGLCSQAIHCSCCGIRRGTQVWHLGCAGDALVNKLKELLA